MKRILAMALASAAGLAFMTTPVNAASKPSMVIGQLWFKQEPSILFAQG